MRAWPIGGTHRSRRDPKIEVVNIIQRKATYSTSHTETNVCSALCLYVCVCVLQFLLGIPTVTISKQMNSLRVNRFQHGLMCFFALVVACFASSLGFWWFWKGGAVALWIYLCSMLLNLQVGTEKDKLSYQTCGNIWPLIFFPTATHALRVKFHFGYAWMCFFVLDTWHWKLVAVCFVYGHREKGQPNWPQQKHILGHLTHDKPTFGLSAVSWVQGTHPFPIIIYGNLLNNYPPKQVFWVVSFFMCYLVSFLAMFHFHFFCFFLAFALEQEAVFLQITQCHVLQISTKTCRQSISSTYISISMKWI